MIDWTHFTPGPSLAGGLLIGAAVAVLLLFNGRIAGISGILGGLAGRPRQDCAWRLAFLGGLLGAPLLAALLGAPLQPHLEAGWGKVLLAGLLVGLGTRYAGGCTSGHGVCGLARGARRSVLATLTFIGAGIVTVFVQRHVLGG